MKIRLKSDKDFEEGLLAFSKLCFSMPSKMSGKINKGEVLNIITELQHTPTLLLRAGEMTSQEIRTVKAILNYIEAKVNIL